MLQDVVNVPVSRFTCPGTHRALVFDMAWPQNDAIDFNVLNTL